MVAAALSPAMERALEDLASTDPSDLSSVKNLREMHARCAAAGVFTAAGPNFGSASAAFHAAASTHDGAADVAKLHLLFDAAVAHGIPHLVCHYVDEVCGRDEFTSPDGVEAYLQDGEMVAEWATAALKSAEQALERASNLRAGGAGSDLERAAIVFEALRDVFRALGASPRGGGGGGGDGGDGDGGFHDRLQGAHDLAVRCAQRARATSFVLRENLSSLPADRHGGPGAWAGSVQVRRTTAAAAAASLRLPPAADPSCLFLDDLLDGVGGHPPPYPFKSPADACALVFGSGSASPPALVAKQSLFLYYLLDAGLDPDGAPARYAASARIHPRLFSQIKAAALLDDWGSPESLEAACASIPRAAHAATPLRFVAALAARGRPDAALAAARARTGGGASAEDDAAAEAELGVAIRLECGLATEAFLVAAEAIAAASHARRAAVSDALVGRLAAHAASRDALRSVLDLPFESDAER